MDHEDGDGDGAGLDGGVDGASGGGKEEPFGGDFGGVSPSDLLRWQPSVSLFLDSLVWPLSFLENVGGLLYRRF